MAANPPQPPQPPFSVTDAMIACGVDNATRSNGSTKAERIALDIFNDDFTTCIDKTIKELESDFSDYSVLSVNQGQIRLGPSTKRNIKAFLKWCKDRFRLNEDPTNIQFPVGDATQILQRYSTHQAFIKKSKSIMETAKPSQFTDKIKWVDWHTTFINFLRVIPGRNGIPLSYICRKVPTVIQPHYADFIDEYIDRAPLTGTAYTTDSAEVYTYLVKFISKNDTSEAKVSMHSSSRDGRLAYIALQEHYEGVGVHAIDVTKADRYLDSLYYNGEKRPHMWWERFELLLNETFTIYNKREGRVVHSEDMKLRILCRKVTADFLQVAKSAIQLQLAQVPLTITYDDALTTFRNAVNAKFPPEIAAANSRNRSRRINEVSRRGGGRSSHRGGRGGRGRFQRGGHRQSGRGGRSQLGRRG